MSNINLLDKKETYTLVYSGNDKQHLKQEVKQINFSSLRELEILKLVLGDSIERIYIGDNDVSDAIALNTLKWNYREPDELFKIAHKIPVPLHIEEELRNIDIPIHKNMVHKQKQENVMISEPKNLGNVWYFRGFADIAELNQDHLSDHVDGIKLFEALRQATLASLHLNGLNHNGVVALTNFKIDYINYVELDTPYVIQAIPACESDGGAMFCVFSIIQNGKIVTKGYLGAYTFRSKEIYLEKRKK